MSPAVAHGSASSDVKKESATARLLGSGMRAITSIGSEIRTNSHQGPLVLRNSSSSTLYDDSTLSHSAPSQTPSFMMLTELKG